MVQPVWDLKDENAGLIPRYAWSSGPINTWDRQAFLTTLRDGKTPSFDPLPREITGNLIFANYGADQGVDNDDGTWVKELG